MDNTTTAAPSSTLSVRGHLIEVLAEQIADGRLKPGTKLPVTRELARQHGVAIETAHKAMRELADRGLIERRPGRGSFVIDCQPPESAPIVGMIAKTSADTGNPFLLALLQEMMCRHIDLRVLDCSAASGAISTVPAVQRLISAKPALIVSVSSDVTTQLQELLPGIPIICLDTIPLRKPTHLVVPAVTASGYLGANCMLASQARHFAYAAIELQSGDHHFSPHNDRACLDTYRWRLAEQGHDCGVIRLPASHDVEPSLMDQLRALPKPIGIFCWLSHRTAQLAKTALAAGLRIPEDVVLLSGNDSEDVAALDLSAIDHRVAQQATCCADLIDTLLKAPFEDDRCLTISMPPRVIIRTSCPEPVPA